MTPRLLPGPHRVVAVPALTKDSSNKQLGDLCDEGIHDHGGFGSREPYASPYDARSCSQGRFAPNIKTRR